MISVTLRKGFLVNRLITGIILAMLRHEDSIYLGRIKTQPKVFYFTSSVQQAEVSISRALTTAVVTTTQERVLHNSESLYLNNN